MYMSNIINKSNHPVQIKRIDVRIWRLRDEIEKAILIRMKEAEAQGIELDIEDIKTFYTRQKPNYLDPNYDPEDDQPEAEVIPIGQDGLDSSGNELDEEALEMMAAMGGGEAPADEEDEAAKLAAEMLGGQGTSSPEEDEAAKLAAEMLGDQGSPKEETKIEEIDKKIVLERVVPDKEHLSYGFALLSDLDMDKILVFSKDTFTFGQNICIEFLIPKSFILSAEVNSSNHIGRTSKIISPTKPDYRISSQFSYLFDGERSNLRDFLRSIEPVIPPPPKRLKRPDSDEEEDDEFEDLGF